MADAELGPELADCVVVAHTGVLERSRAVEDFLAFGCRYSVHQLLFLDDDSREVFGDHCDLLFRERIGPFAVMSDFLSLCADDVIK